MLALSGQGSGKIAKIDNLYYNVCLTKNTFKPPRILLQRVLVPGQQVSEASLAHGSLQCILPHFNIVSGGRY